jgi:hypothetical protein
MLMDEKVVPKKEKKITIKRKKLCNIIEALLSRQRMAQWSLVCNEPIFQSL